MDSAARLGLRALDSAMGFVVEDYGQRCEVVVEDHGQHHGGAVGVHGQSHGQHHVVVVEAHGQHHGVSVGDHGQLCAHTLPLCTDSPHPWEPFPVWC